MLNTHQVEQLLAVCAGFDNRRHGDINVLAWQKASDHGHWSLDEATEAVCEWYSEKTDFVMPAHVQALIRKQRAHDEALREVDQRRAITGTTRSFKDLWDGIQLASSDRRAARKATVLAHPDLAAQLCQPPIGYKQPEQWTGGLPPLTDVEGRLTYSPRAQALHALADEAERRARAAG